MKHDSGPCELVFPYVVEGPAGSCILSLSSGIEITETVGDYSSRNSLTDLQIEVGIRVRIPMPFLHTSSAQVLLR